MKNKIFHKSLLISSILPFLAGCASFNIEFEKYFYQVKDNDTHETVENEGYVKLGNYSPLTFVNKDSEVETFNSFQEVFRSQNYLHSINSTGVNKILVIPIDFNDYGCDRLTHGCKLSRTLVQNAFFGKESRTQYESVASYFDKSSYGKLKLDGFVTDWYHLDLVDSSGQRVNYEYLSSKSTPKSIVANIYKSALTWYQNKYGNLSSYFIDGDEKKGVPIYFIYSAPNVDASSASESALWAYTFNTGGVFAWSSFSMLNLNMTNQVDTHTLIHETGHMLGLQDYYSTSTTKQYSPTGHMDMMDYSLGDETGYSKMLLNWARPYKIKNTTEIKIRPFVDSGDLILINDSWNETAMDEYLLIEMYSPIGLNELDSKNRNPESKLFTVPGIKIYHVDSRVAYFAANKITPLAYVTDGGYKSSLNRIGVAHSNTIVSSHNILKNPLYQLLSRDPNENFMNGGNASDSTLFKQGDSFGINTYQNYTFHNGNQLGYKIEVKSLNNDEATLVITRT